jgi:regulator of sigma E protease
MAIVAAGPAANYLFAIVVLALVYGFLGKPHADPVVGKVVEHSAAEAAGLQAGDRFLALNGTPVDEFGDLITIIQLNLDKPLDMEIERDGRTLHLKATPQIVTDKDLFGNVVQTPRLGVVQGGTSSLVKVGPSGAIRSAAAETWTQTVVILTGAWQMISGQRPSDEIRGVAGIAKMAGDVAALGFVSFVMFAVMLSINLGLINLFPVPMLDGGHLAYYAIEAVRGKPLGERAQEFGLKIGLALVLSLMLFATWNDLVYLKVVDFVKSLFT